MPAERRRRNPRTLVRRRSPRSLGAAGRNGDRAKEQVPGESDLLPTPRGRLWQRVARALLVCTIVSAVSGVLGIIVQDSVLLGRMTTDVSIAQQRTTNLHNLQREALRLLQQLTELNHGGDIAAVTVRRGLLARQVSIVWSLFPTSSPQARRLQDIQLELSHFPWSRLEKPEAAEAAAQATAKTLISGIEVQIKNLYDEQENFFYEATLHSLKAKRDSQHALVLLLSLVVLLAVCWLVLLRRLTRNRLVLAYSALLTEVSERRILQNQLSHQAFHDALTGLPNRALFIRRLAESMQVTGESTGPPSAVLIDLDGFKNVNDTLGHGAGDELLQRIAERLRGCTRVGDTVARLGGDEFAIVVPAESGNDALAVSQRLIDALRTPIRVAGQEISINASIGIAEFDGQSGPDDLLADADIAMYAAKKAGKARYEVFRRGMRDQTLQRARLEQQLVRAVELAEIEVFYQPIIDLGTDRVIALEALARWRHPTDGLISPAVFIPVAEESGLIREIGRDVLRQACRTVQHWRQSIPGSEHLSVTVNLSVRQLLSGTFSDHLREALRESGLPSSSLTLEITESMLLDDSDTVGAELALIKDLGVRLAMDDFGAGYSSIALLLRLQVNVLKIDKTFLDLDNRNRGTLIRAVTELGHTLGLTVVAEGVETIEQLAHVRAASCDAAQGFLLSRPMPVTVACQYLEDAGPDNVALQPALDRNGT
jgi:diguanylate cyclase (GGDEF)-like protein